MDSSEEGAENTSECQTEGLTPVVSIFSTLLTKAANRTASSTCRRNRERASK